MSENIYDPVEEPRPTLDSWYADLARNKAVWSGWLARMLTKPLGGLLLGLGLSGDEQTTVITGVVNYAGGFLLVAIPLVFDAYQRRKANAYRDIAKGTPVAEDHPLPALRVATPSRVVY